MFEKELEEYLSTLKGRSGGEAGSELRKKVVSAVTAMSRILDAQGLTRPNERSYQTYRDNSTVDNSNTAVNINRIKKFFSWLDEKQERTDEMTAEITENTAVTEATQDTEIEPVKRQKGIRRVQISIYLEPEIYKIMTALSRLSGASVADMSAKATTEFAKKNSVKAEKVIRALQDIENIEF